MYGRQELPTCEPAPTRNAEVFFGIGKMKKIKIKEYNSIHFWIRKNYGNADRCENKFCKKISKNFQWALKPEKIYKKNINCFIQLCKSCHSLQDSIESKKRNFIVEPNQENITSTRISEALYKRIERIARRSKRTIKATIEIAFDCMEGLRKETS